MDKNNPTGEPDELNGGSPVDLDEGERKFLLALARDTLEGQVRGTGIPENVPERSGFTGKMKLPAGVFVTLRKKGSLRGCIGYVRGFKPLYEAVMDNAVNASEDPRFTPVREEELNDIDIEISVLGPLEPAADPEDVVVGRHGVYLTKGMRSGLLLPQVALEQGWDREEFLDYTCLKAGLTRNCWKGGDVDIYIFRAAIFSELG